MTSEAEEWLIRNGGKNVRVLDGVHTGKGSEYKSPLPDVVGELRGRKVAIECGWMSGGCAKRITQLKTAGYQIVIHWPYLECFDITMTLPSQRHDHYRDKPSV